MPKIARATSVRPEPTKPASPTISPRRSSNETSEKIPSLDRPSARARPRRSRPASFGKSASSERPTIRRMISPCGSSASRARGDVTAVAQHGDRVGDRCDLFEPVADEDDRDAALPQPAHGREEALDLVRRQRRGRLVHDQQPRARRQRLRDLEQLPVRDAEPAHGRVGAEVDAELVEDRRIASAASPAQSTVRSRPRGCRPAKTFSATVRSGNTVGSWYMATMPSRCAVCGSPIRCAPPVDQELAVVGLDDAGEDLHQRRLARAVLPDECVHRRRLDREADVGDRLDAAVALRDPAELDQRSASPARSSRVRGGDAAVDVDDVAGRLRRARPGEEGDRLGDVLGVDVDPELRALAIEASAARPR